GDEADIAKVHEGGERGSKLFDRGKGATQLVLDLAAGEFGELAFFEPAPEATGFADARVGTEDGVDFARVGAEVAKETAGAGDAVGSDDGFVVRAGIGGPPQVVQDEGESGGVGLEHVPDAEEEVGKVRLARFLGEVVEKS